MPSQKSKTVCRSESSEVKMIQIKNVSKSYGDIIANHEITLEIKEGLLVGLLGSDGAGKSTLMRQICALIAPDQGQILIAGKDTVKNQTDVRSMIGYMPQKFSLYSDLSVEQNILFFADLFNVPIKERGKRLEDLYRFSMLGPFKDRPAGKLSGGMKQKLALSCNLIRSPKYLILDEPTFGVDPVSRQEFWEIIKELQKQGTTILASTPYLDEAETFDQVALMMKSELIDFNSPANIISAFPYSIYSVNAIQMDFFQNHPKVHAYHFFGHDLRIAFKDEPSQEEWQSWIQGKIINSYKKEIANLEDVFLTRMQS